MRALTLHVGLRVADAERSLAFYAALGYEVVGTVPETSFGALTMLKLPADEFVTIELVDPPAGTEITRGNGLSHLVVQVDSMDAMVTALAEAGIEAEDVSPAEDEMRTAWVTDPDGNKIELVQWPPGYGDGMTAALFEE